MIEYDWDPDKEAENVRQHGFDFYEATVALRDPFAVEWFDQDRSIDEVRFIAIGCDLQGRFLTVVTSDDWPKPRIISARRATKRERHAHEHQRPPDPG